MSVHLNVAAVGIAYTEHGDFFAVQEKTASTFLRDFATYSKIFRIFQCRHQLRLLKLCPKGQFRFPYRQSRNFPTRKSR